MALFACPPGIRMVEAKAEVIWSFLYVRLESSIEIFCDSSQVRTEVGHLARPSDKVSISFGAKRDGRQRGPILRLFLKLVLNMITIHATRIGAEITLQTSWDGGLVIPRELAGSQKCLGKPAEIILRIRRNFVLRSGR
jgi:hypothetical protein